MDAPRCALPPLATCLFLILIDSSINPRYITNDAHVASGIEKVVFCRLRPPPFMPSRPVVFRRRSGRLFPQVDGSGQRAEFMTKKDGVVTEEPLVVWVDGGSASSSEVRQTGQPWGAVVRRGKKCVPCFHADIPLKRIDPHQLLVDRLAPNQIHPSL